MNEDIEITLFIYLFFTLSNPKEIYLLQYSILHQDIIIDKVCSLPQPFLHMK